jgi:hypothetical protein
VLHDVQATGSAGCDSSPMEPTLAMRADVFNRLLLAWNDADPEAVCDVVTPGYQGHMLHLPQAERSGTDYPHGSVTTVSPIPVPGSTSWTNPPAGTGCGLASPPRSPAGQSPTAST